MEEANVSLLLSAGVIRYAMAGPRERPLLAHAASAADASEIIPPPLNQAG